jgi:hypothetical protein
MRQEERPPLGDVLPLWVELGNETASLLENGKNLKG